PFWHRHLAAGTGRVRWNPDHMGAGASPQPAGEHAHGGDDRPSAVGTAEPAIIGSTHVALRRPRNVDPAAADLAHVFIHGVGVWSMSRGGERAEQGTPHDVRTRPTVPVATTGANVDTFGPIPSRLILV